MKKHIGFLGVLLSVLSLFLYLAAHFNERNLFLFHGPKEDLGHFLDTFREHHRPLIEINFSALYGAHDRFEILHPLLDVRRMPFLPPWPLCSASDSSDDTLGASCQFEQVLMADTEHQSKEKALGHFLAGNSALPSDFLSSPPFINPFGRSYARVLLDFGGKAFREKAWVERHLSFFKVSELSDVMKNYDLHLPDFTVIASLDETEVEAVVRGDALVLTKHYLLLKNESRLGFSPLSYLAYAQSDVSSSLKDGEYDLLPQASAAYCLERVGNACWSYSSRHALAYLYRYSLAILVLVALLFFGILILYLKHLHDKTKEQLQNRLSLQVLSHEFRTPVASSLLILEELSRDVRLDESSRDRVTRLSTEIYRLQRVLEISRRYLQADSRRIRFQPETIASINDWLADFVNEQQAHVQYHPLESDRPLRADPFWLRFVLSNLVQNALAHGRAPVTVSLRCTARAAADHGRGSGRVRVRLAERDDGCFHEKSAQQGYGPGPQYREIHCQRVGSRNAILEISHRFFGCVTDSEVKRWPPF